MVNLDFQEDRNSHTALYELVQSRSLLPIVIGVYVYCEWALKTLRYSGEILKLLL